MYVHHVVLDFEMTPVSRENKDALENLCEEVIEIGALKLDKYGKTDDRFCCMVRPQYSRSVSATVTKLTGICTKDLSFADTFDIAVRKFSEWIGSEKARIYSWSDSDLLQIKRECFYKGIRFPENMRRWTDLQAVYPRIMGRGRRSRPALHTAVKECGIEFDEKRAHRALYDAEKTAELLRYVITGEYRGHVRKMRDVVRSEVMPMTNSMDAASGGKLSQLLQQMKRQQMTTENR